MTSKSSIRCAQHYPGEIRINQVDLVLDTKSARAWEVDVVSKYAIVSSIGDAGTVMLSATDRTLNVDENRRGEPTILTFDVPDNQWILMAECRRYTCRVVAYLPNRPAGAACGDFPAPCNCDDPVEHD